MTELRAFLRITPMGLLALACSEEPNDGLVQTPDMNAANTSAAGGSMGLGGAGTDQGGAGATSASGQGGTSTATGTDQGGADTAVGADNGGATAAAGGADAAGGMGGAGGGGMDCPGYIPDLCGTECVDLASDPAFCGDCMTQCDAGAACLEGSCGTAPTELAVIDSCGELTLDLFEGTLYLTNNTGDAAGTVLSLPVAGGDPATVAGDQNQPGAIAADTNGVYWATGDGSVMKAPLPMGDPVALVTGLDPAPRDIAVANDLVFYSSGDLFYKIPTSGEAAEGTYVTCTPLNGIASALFADAERIYWTSDSRQAVETDEQTDGVPFEEECAELGDEGYIELGESQGSLLHDAVFAVGGSAYWASGDQIRRAPLENPSNQTVAFEVDIEQVTGFTVTDTMVYLAGAGGTVQSLNYATDLAGTPTPLAIGQDTARFLAVDATNVYWVTADCKVMATAL